MEKTLSSEEDNKIFKMQKIFVLKVHIHCNGCRLKLKKLVEKINGIHNINIDEEEGKVKIFGDIDPSVVIKVLANNGKHAQLLDETSVIMMNNNQNTQISQGNTKCDGGGAIGQDEVKKPKIKGLKLTKLKSLMLPFSKSENHKYRYSRLIHQL
ncbi:hypothetical protein ZOSMA_94G00110 [Zostera marina]|uniref:HMA domain-containing protein n=1 Tax=Zostera marina TaxID=29655 RepID=A0A0K9NK68_ZOSMR|nr:hypothetical protein ZOSMA_94G00110 [Zostera marina]